MLDRTPAKRAGKISTAMRLTRFLIRCVFSFLARVPRPGLTHGSWRPGRSEKTLALAWPMLSGCDRGQRSRSRVDHAHRLCTAAWPLRHPRQWTNCRPLATDQRQVAFGTGLLEPKTQSDEGSRRRHPFWGSCSASRHERYVQRSLLGQRNTLAPRGITRPSPNLYEGHNHRQAAVLALCARARLCGRPGAGRS